MNPAADTRQYSIVVIDDDRSVCSALCRLLRATGFAAASYPSAAEFLLSLESKRPDCLILDVQMPAMNGHELQQELKAMGVALPIIMITGHDDAMAHAKCMAAGASTYFNKPLDSTTLLRAIEKAIADRPREA